MRDLRRQLLAAVDRSLVRLLAPAAAVDRLNERIGALCGWLTLLMVLIGAYNAVVRYLGRWLGGNLSSNVYLEAQWYLFSLVFLLGAAYTLRRGAHVRVDLFYGRLSGRGKAWIDLVGSLVLLLPFTLVSLWLSWPSVRNSWAVREVSPDPGGLARYPIKTMILVAFALLALQGLSQAVKNLAVVRGLRAAGAGDVAGVAGDVEAGGTEDGRRGVL